MSDSGTGDLILSCLARLARADGRVADAELREIHDIVRELTGMDPALDVLRALVDEEVDEGDGVFEFVARRAGSESLDVRLLVARAGYRVLASDGEITGSEVHTFHALLEALDLPLTLVVAHLD
jgi:tellurite resistance protein